jgi:hypothetical protein
MYLLKFNTIDKLLEISDKNLSNHCTLMEKLMEKLNVEQSPAHKELAQANALFIRLISLHEKLLSKKAKTSSQQTKKKIISIENLENDEEDPYEAIGEPPLMPTTPEPLSVDATCLFERHIADKRRFKRLKKDDPLKPSLIAQAEKNIAELKAKIQSLNSYSQFINLAKTYGIPSNEETRSRLKRIIASINKQDPLKNPTGYIFRIGS